MNVNFTENLEKGMNYLHKKGAFLTVKDNDITNAMTISWGNIGYEWNRPVFTVLVRKSRYTHRLMQRAKEFTVSIPLDDNLKNALLFCGTKSGRDLDKIKESKISLEESKAISTPVIAGCGLYYECKVVYKQDMDPSLLSEDVKLKNYSSEDYHTLYFGEILDCYSK